MQAKKKSAGTVTRTDYIRSHQSGEWWLRLHRLWKWEESLVWYFSIQTWSLLKTLNIPLFYRGLNCFYVFGRLEGHWKCTYVEFFAYYAYSAAISTYFSKLCRNCMSCILCIFCNYALNHMCNGLIREFSRNAYRPLCKSIVNARKRCTLCRYPP